ncbi:MAG: hypothetical protein EBY17_14765 [Acidobacteriia bacterium]|nr:hypothetical protein [Terriglobia bacterium]
MSRCQKARQEPRIVLQRTVSQLLLLSILCTGLRAGEPVAAPAHTEPAAMEGDALPAFSIHAVPPAILDAQLRSIRRYQRFVGCKVAPLPEIWDAEVLAYEDKAETAPADVDGLMPDAAQALDTMKEMVTSLGGTFDLKSAYRPTSYQAHLHEVWMKWKQLLLVGLFLSIGLGILGVLAVTFGRMSNTLGKPYDLTVIFTNASGLSTGADVLLAGARVGYIGAAPQLLVTFTAIAGVALRFLSTEIHAANS